MQFGPGQLLADFRWGGDFGVIDIHDTDIAYSRGMVSFTVGYGFGFIDRKKP
jgi:hypothetical protein